MTFPWTCCPRSKDVTLTPDQYVAVLKTGHYPLYFLLACQLGLVLAWQLTSIVPGFCPLENVSSFNAVCHTGWWLALEMVVLCLGAAAPTFDLWVVEFGGAESGGGKNTSATRKMCIAWMVFLWIALVSNIIHLVATCVEYSAGCTTTLCAQYGSYLFAFIWILAFLIGTEMLLIVRLFVYLRDLFLLHRALVGTGTVMPAKKEVVAASKLLAHKLR